MQAAENWPARVYHFLDQLGGPFEAIRLPDLLRETACRIAVPRIVKNTSQSFSYAVGIDFVQRHHRPSARPENALCDVWLVVGDRDCNHRDGMGETLECAVDR